METRRGSDGGVASRRKEMEARRNSSPSITADDLAVIRRPKKNSDSAMMEKRKRHSSYIELLEEVTHELNLQAVKVDSNNTDLIIQNAFNFLDEVDNCDNAHQS